MGKEQIKELITKFMVNEMEIDSTRINDEAQLVQDIGMTSLDFVDIKAFIVREFHFTLDSSAIKGISTLTELYEYVYQHQG